MLSVRLVGRRRGERGAAVVDFVLISLILVPLFLGIVHLGLVLYVRNTLTAAATEGARSGAALDRGPSEASQRTRQQIDSVLADRFSRQITAERGRVGGLEVVEVRIRAEIPPLGMWGPATRLDIKGHAIVERLP